MVTREFAIKAAEGYRGLDGDNENTTGNAFDGTKESYDREMWNALDAVSMLGEEAVNPSSIANAQLRVTSIFAEAGANKKGKAERGLSIEQMMLLENIRDLIAGIDQRIEVIEQEIDFLNTIADDDAIMTAESYDDLSQEDQARLDRFLDIADITLEEYLALSVEERIQLRDDVLEAKRENVIALRDTKAELLEIIDNNSPDTVLNEPLPVINNQFTDAELEAAVLRWEADNEREFDRHNVLVSDLKEVLRIVNDDYDEGINQREEYAQVAEIDTQVSEDLNLLGGLQIKL